MSQSDGRVVTAERDENGKVLFYGIADVVDKPSRAGRVYYTREVWERALRESAVAIQYNRMPVVLHAPADGRIYMRDIVGIATEVRITDEGEVYVAGFVLRPVKPARVHLHPSTGRVVDGDPDSGGVFAPHPGPTDVAPFLDAGMLELTPVATSDGASSMLYLHGFALVPYDTQPLTVRSRPMPTPKDPQDVWDLPHLKDLVPEHRAMLLTLLGAEDDNEVATTRALLLATALSTNTSIILAALTRALQELPTIEEQGTVLLCSIAMAHGWMQNLVRSSLSASSPKNELVATAALLANPESWASTRASEDLAADAAESKVRGS